ncbi:MAG: phospholipase D family protein [Halieaceae bacterium]|jgi:putative cardiolipin synthase|nr:phospholipase D family protein [Halieaceae bacterium]
MSAPEQTFTFLHISAHVKAGRWVGLIGLSLFLVACASAPMVNDKPASYFNDRGAVESPLTALASAHPRSGVSLLADPDDALQSRLHLAALAQSTLDLQYYLWQGDDSGLALTYEVLRAAERGVRVRILLDDIYHSGRDSAYQTLDSHPNVEVRLFNPMGNRGSVKQMNYAVGKSAFNYRMHNKIFLVDGVAAILGGRNIGDEYFGRDASFNFQDMDAIAIGEVAADTGEAFDLFWNAELAIPVSALTQRTYHITEEQTAQLITARERVRPAVERGRAASATRADWLATLASGLLWTKAEILVDRPDRSDDYPDSAFMTFMHDAHAQPRESAVIQTAYLIPNGPTLANLERLTSAGVTLRILTNSAKSNNHSSVHAYYAGYRKALLTTGIDLYEVQGKGSLAAYLDRVGEDAHAGLHTKAMVIDDRVAVIGSYNMDPRSRVWNSEIALIVRDPDFARQVLQEMERDFAPEASWRLSLDDTGALIWTGESGDELVQLTKDPGSSWWDRFLWGMLRLLPLENEL